MNTQITIGFCTAQHNPAFKNYLLDLFKGQIEIIEKIGSKDNPISKCYNEIIKESSNDIVMLIHDDITFEKMDKYPLPIIELFPRLFQNNSYGIIGFYGGTKMIKEKMEWSNGEGFGHVIQGYKFKNHPDRYVSSGIKLPKFTLDIQKVLTVDGALMLVNKKRIKVNFDEKNTSFHHYDIDFCLSNFIKNVDVGVTKAFLIRHKSEEHRGKEHDEALKNFMLPKWESLLPISLPRQKVIYTCITGGYDTIIEPLCISKDFDYVCFTDNPETMHSKIWKFRPLPKDVGGLSDVKKQRKIKILPHKNLKEYDISIWVDGSILIKKDVSSWVEKTLTDEITCYIPKHPARKCIYKEADACVRIKKDTLENVQPQTDRYKKEGYPKNNGMVQSNIILRKHNEPDCIALMENGGMSYIRGHIETNYLLITHYGKLHRRNLWK